MFSGNELPVNIRNSSPCIIPAVFPGQWIYSIRAEWNFSCRKDYSLLNRSFDVKTWLKFAPNFCKKDHYTRILAHWNSMLFCNLNILQNCLELGFCNIIFLGGFGFSECIYHIFRKFSFCFSQKVYNRLNKGFTADF